MRRQGSLDCETADGRAFAAELAGLLRCGWREALRRGKPVLVSTSRRIGSLDAVDIFGRGSLIAADRLFWAQPRNDFAMVGLGVACSIDTTGALRFKQTAAAWRQLLEGAIIDNTSGTPGVGPLLVGGFSFDTQRTAAQIWQGYPDGRMILPRILLTFSSGTAWLTLNALIGPESDFGAEVAAAMAMYSELLASDSQRAGVNPCGATTDETARPVVEEVQPSVSWLSNVEGAVSAIRQGGLKKAVLARAVRLTALRPFDTTVALDRLAASYPSCYIFAMAFGDRCFLGATPEQLVRLRDGRIEATCVAGSIGRGLTTEEDDQLSQTLLANAKERAEHALVVQAFAEALGDLCDQLQAAKAPTVLKLSNIQHLCTQVTGRLRAGHTILELVERLHPTPAVGGVPRQAALKLIRESEGLDRGWYAGPVGWLDQRGEGEFVVAIRSALLRGAEAVLFAGCGIMADSDPEKEYAESCLKLQPMLSALMARQT